MVGCVFGQDTAALFGRRQAHGPINNPEINEASGLVASSASKGCFWTHNDSGDDARIFLIDDSARYRATYYLQGVSAHDWEDIAMMEQTDGGHYLVIGDIGDNRAQRPYVYVHILKEPLVPVKTTTVDTLPSEQIRSFVMRYEDGPRDAESLFFDPLDKRLYVISKRELEVGVYTAALPESTADTLTLRKVGVLPHVFITSAAIRSDGTEVLLKSLLQVFYWKRKPGESIVEMFRRPATPQPYKPEPQGEAIAFAVDGEGYYTLGEAVLGMPSVLYFYPRF
ncbi:hypothetical protein [Parapedobacter sp.]